MTLKKYNLDYQGGKCPLGYEFVGAYSRGNVHVPSFCRKMPVYRFKKDPETRLRESEERQSRESWDNAVRTYWERRELDPRQFGEEREL